MSPARKTQASQARGSQSAGPGTSLGLRGYQCKPQPHHHSFLRLGHLLSKSAPAVAVAVVALCLASQWHLCAAVCPLGRYDPGTGVCQDCSPGQYGALSGVVPSCLPCTPPSPFSNAGQTSCYGGCPDLTWTTWVDVAGVEGAHSCVKLVSGSLSWAQAQASCSSLGTGVHLLSAKQARVKLTVSCIHRIIAAKKFEPHALQVCSACLRGSSKVVFAPLCCSRSNGSANSPQCLLLFCCVPKLGSRAKVLPTDKPVLTRT